MIIDISYLLQIDSENIIYNSDDMYTAIYKKYRHIMKIIKSDISLNLSKYDIIPYIPFWCGLGSYLIILTCKDLIRSEYPDISDDIDDYKAQNELKEIMKKYYN